MYEAPTLSSCEEWPVTKCWCHVSRTSHMVPEPRRSPRMFVPVCSVLPDEYHSAGPVRVLVGSKKRRAPNCMRASFDAFAETAVLCSNVVFQFFRSSVCPYDGSETPPTRKLSSVYFS